MDVAAATVAARAGALDQADPLQHVEVVGQEVGLDPEAAAQLDRRPVGHGQLVDDGEADRVTEGGMAGRPFRSPLRGSRHSLWISLNRY